METEEKQQFTEEQIRVHNIIQEWKRRKLQDEAEAREQFNSPAFKEILKELRRRNAEKGIIIP